MAAIFRVMASVSAAVFIVSSFSDLSKRVDLTTSTTPGMSLPSASSNTFSLPFFEARLVPSGCFRVWAFFFFSSLRTP
ncbi:hypothetical protein EDD16DRAFT_1648817 [Pisolithus croceorrhizus]|nr:hypothetical protein EDD16DRAFT_1648817 [Pisolithus croceorrhizus]